MICPTHVGWLLAIDRLEHRIRWATRYVETGAAETGGYGVSVAAAGQINSRWCPAGPLLFDEYVVLTPMELPDSRGATPAQVICWDASTGERLWQRPKDQSLFTAGISPDKLLLVGSDRVDCRDLKDGSLLWSSSIAADAGPPAGRGVLTASHYLLPLQSGALRLIRLSDGIVDTETRPLADQPLLGNLVMAGSRLFSLNVRELTCFPERSVLVSEIAQLRAKNPTSSQGDLLEAQMHLADDRPVDALASLDDAANLNDAPTRERLRLKWDALLRIVEQNPDCGDDIWQALQDAGESAEQKLRVADLLAKRLISRQEWSQAFAAYWTLRDSEHPEYITEGLTRQQFDVWLAGRLSTVCEAVDPIDRAKLDQQIHLTIEGALGDPGASQERLSRLLSIHPGRYFLEQYLAGGAILAGHIGAAEIRLLRLLSSQAPLEIRRVAIQTLVQLMQDTGRPEDAEMYATMALELPLPESSPVTEAVSPEFDAPMESDETNLTNPGSSRDVWGHTEFEFHRLGSAMRVLGSPLVNVANAPPSFDRLRVETNPSLGRLRLLDDSHPKPVWETPLRAQAQSFHHPLAGATAIGSVLMVVNRGVLHAISVTDRKLLWSPYSFDPQSAVAGFERNPTDERPRDLQTAGSFVAWQGLRRFQTPHGMLAVARPEYLAVYGRGDVSVLDPLTGERLWTRSGLSPRTMVHGTSDRLYVVPPAPAKPFALRADDGQEVPLDRLPQLIATAIDVVEGGVVTLETRSQFTVFGGRSSVTHLSLVDPATGDVRWERMFSDKRKWARLDPHELLAMGPGGELQLVDTASGRMLPMTGGDLASIPDDSRAYAVADRQHIFLLLNGPRRSAFYNGNGLVSVPADGVIQVYDRHTGKLAWQREVSQKELVVEQFGVSPVLLLVARHEVHRADISHHEIEALMLDKLTGDVLLDSRQLVVNFTVRQFQLNVPERTIELRMPNERLRIQPVRDDAQVTTGNGP